LSINMAQKKSSRPVSKLASDPKRTSLRNMPSKQGTSSRRQPAAKKPNDNWSSLHKKPASKKPSTSRAQRPIREGLSLDRKLDILGVALTLVGFLTLLSFLSPINSSLIGAWVSGLGKTFGWGKYIFPLALMLSGLWLVLRNFERIPQFAVERVLGIILLFLNLLAVFHLAGISITEESALALAQVGKGGGYLGAAVAGGLQTILGTGGTIIALIAWLFIALALTLDLTVIEMVRWIPPIFNRLQDWIIETREEYRNHQSKGRSPYVSMGTPSPLSHGTAQSEQIELTPIPRTDSILPLGQTLQARDAPRTWVLPPVHQILEQGEEVTFSEELDQQRVRVIEESLASFGAPARVVEINRGPAITQFGVEPDFIESRGGRMRVRVSKIASLADDLALALSARTIRVQAPVPGKGFVGIEVPNEKIALVALRDLIESEAFKRLKSPLRFALGLSVSGNAFATDLTVMPHLLIAGATGSGKSVCVNSLIACLLLHNTPDDIRLVMVDPKRVELTNYNGIPHLLAPVVVELERVVTVLQWVLREMDMRYHKLAEAGCRNIQEYNNLQTASGAKKLPYLVVIVDELADLMILSPEETERAITRLAQLARATGIHLVIATQRPSVDVVTGLIKANFPARIAFAVTSGVDSRVVLDQPGAERLLGRGDMLFQAPDAPAPVRLQGVFVSDSEILSLVTYWQSQAGLAPTTPTTAGGTVDGLESGLPLKQMPLWEDMEKDENADPLLNEAIDLSRRQGRASISMLQRRLRIGYTRAARLVETMEDKGIVGPPDPSTGTREILDYGPAAPPVGEE
jgi:S-DNA-T family DNA segregation ATPase FtsK/SpoIIIE